MKGKNDTLIVSVVVVSTTALLFLATPKKIQQALTRPLTTAYGRLFTSLLVWNKTKTDKADDEDTTFVAELLYYPVKSLRRIAVDSATLGSRGFLNDRAYMLVTPSGGSLTSSSSAATHRFLSQRQYPNLTQVTVVCDSANKTLRLSSPSFTKSTVTTPQTAPSDAPIYTARVWGQTVQVQDMGDAAATFLQSIVEKDKNYDTEGAPKVRLVQQLSADSRTPKDHDIPSSARGWLGQNPLVSLADGFPLLMTSESSLKALNERLEAKGKAPLPMTRFRPNLVVEGWEPFAEDRIKIIRVGTVVFHVANGCPRCKQSCTDQETGQVTDEPLETLREFRQMTEDPELLYFGANLIAAPGSEGQQVKVGDPVTVLKRGEPAWSEG